jgi:hypothetical protein
MTDLLGIRGNILGILRCLVKFLLTTMSGSSGPSGIVQWASSVVLYGPRAVAKLLGKKDNPPSDDENKHPAPSPVSVPKSPSNNELPIDYSLLHAHRSESPFVRTDWVDESPLNLHDDFYDHENTILASVGTFLQRIPIEGTYDILSYLNIKDLCSVISCSRGFHQVGKRLKSNKSYLRMCAFQGFPDKFRIDIWFFVLNTVRDMHELEQEYWKLVPDMNKETKAKRTLLRDVSRTFPDEVLFRGSEDEHGNIVKNSSGHEMLAELLTIYSLYDPQLGYTQGMNYLAGFLLLNCRSPERCFKLLVAMMNEYDQRWMFLPGLPHLNQFLWMFEQFLNMFLPKLAEHFQKHGVVVTMYAVEWFVTLFTYILPRSTVQRIWDLYFVDSLVVLFRVGVALLKRSEYDLLSMDFEGMLNYLKRFPNAAATDPEGLMMDSKSLPIDEFLFEELEEMYINEVIIMGKK